MNNELSAIVKCQIKNTIVPELRKEGFKGSFPHFRRIFENGRVDFLSFQFNKWGGSFIVEIAVAYPYKGKEGNFFYWDEITPEFLKKSDYGYTKERFRIEPHKGEWFEYNDKNYEEVVEYARKLIVKNASYFDKQDKKYCRI